MTLQGIGAGTVPTWVVSKNGILAARMNSSGFGRYIANA